MRIPPRFAETRRPQHDLVTTLQMDDPESVPVVWAARMVGIEGAPEVIIRGIIAAVVISFDPLAILLIAAVSFARGDRMIAEIKNALSVVIAAPETNASNRRIASPRHCSTDRCGSATNAAPLKITIATGDGMRRVFRWAVRIGFGIVAFFASVWAILFILNPDGTRLLAAVLVGQLVSNRHPPPVADGVIASDDWRDRDVLVGELTDALQKQFPVGTAGAALRSVLLRQGFRPLKLSPPPFECAAGRQSPGCPIYYPDPNRSLEYAWAAGLVCSENIRVEWKTDDAGGITGIKGSYYEACL
jgi:hypothetical protein